MIEKINNILKEIGSNFRTNNGYTICAYVGHLTFLKKEFNDPDELYEFVKSVKNRLAE